MSNITSNAILAEKIFFQLRKRNPELSNLYWNDIHDVLEESRPTKRALDDAEECALNVAHKTISLQLRLRYYV